MGFFAGDNQSSALWQKNSDRQKHRSELEVQGCILFDCAGSHKTRDTKFVQPAFTVGVLVQVGEEESGF